MKKIDLNLHSKRFADLVANPITDFPSAEHELAFKIAMYFDEPYGFWVRQVQKTHLLLGQVEKEFYFVIGTAWGKRQQVRTLMKIMFKKR